MSVRFSWLDNSVIFLLGLIIAVDGALFLYVRAAVAHSIQDPSLLYRFAEYSPTPPPDGLTSNGVKVKIVPKRNSGWAVRYAAKACEYCRADETLWRGLSAELKELGYQVIVVVPTQRDE